MMDLSVYCKLGENSGSLYHLRASRSNPEVVTASGFCEAVSVLGDEIASLAKIARSQ